MYIECQKGHDQAKIPKTRSKRTKGDKRVILRHVSSHTHAWVSRVVSHAITLNIGIIIIFILKV